MNTYRIISNGTTYRLQYRFLLVFWFTIGERYYEEFIPNDYKNIDEALHAMECHKSMDEQERNMRKWNTIYTEKGR